MILLQTPPPPPSPPNGWMGQAPFDNCIACVPIDGYSAVLLLAGIGLGLIYLWIKQKKDE